MQAPLKVVQARLRAAFPTLRDVGVAVQWFPAYRSPADPRHRIAHDILYLSFLVRGEAVHDIGDAAVAERSGSLAVVQRGVPHRIDTQGRAVEVVNIYLDPERHALPSLPDDLRGALHCFLPLHQGRAYRAHRLLAVAWDDPASIVTLLARMHAEQNLAESGHQAVLAAQLRELLVLIARRLAAVGAHGPAAPDAVVESACAWAGERLDHDLSADDLARAAGTTRFALARHFRTHLGVAPMAWLMERRLAEAGARLRDEDEPVVAVAQACGFKDQAHFSKRFKALYGTTPAAWRLRARGDSPRRTGGQDRAP